jgi:sugar O-acyltransferase (sialic acid O-acetyltransferase NeuD family)
VRVAIVGAGGHGKVVADALLAGPGHELSGFLDDDPSRQRTTIWGYPVLGSVATWSRHGVEGLALGIGDNAKRKALFLRLRQDGAHLIGVRHPSVTLGRGSAIGAGTAVLARCVVNADALVGENVILNTACTVDHDCVIGAHAHLAPGVHLAGDVRIGEGTFVGIGAVVLPGVTVGAWSTIGAGAVVVRDVVDGATVTGVPGRER